jgi:hypothetical protein
LKKTNRTEIVISPEDKAGETEDLPYAEQQKRARIKKGRRKTAGF